ncbi:DNA-binding protein [Ottowia testudinis]|nr:DNA-binding protein [Ottowia testudinis]
MRTPQEARKELLRKGVPIIKWAKEHGVPRSVVYGVLSGRLVGTFGHAHRAAVLLGLKDGEV